MLVDTWQTSGWVLWSRGSSGNNFAEDWPSRLLPGFAAAQDVAALTQHCSFGLSSCF